VQSIGTLMWSRVALGAMALLLAIAAGFSAAPTASAQDTVKLEFFGHSFFRLTSPNGKIVLLNPWIQGNQSVTVSMDDITQADLILVPDAHADEQGQAVDIAMKTGAFLVGSGSLGTYFLDKGVSANQTLRFIGPGDRVVRDGITVRFLASDHDSMPPDRTERVSYGGQASSFMITFENGYTIYFMASSPMRSEMALWGSMYKPDLMIFHMSGAHEPLDIAMAIKLMTTDNPNLSTLMWHHNVPDPTSGTTVADVQAALSALGVNIPITNQVRSQVYELTK
jgi:L-ascorbate metabolism protein UlaG (beta-lactamase superfamily)